MSQNNLNYAYGNPNPMYRQMMEAQQNQTSMPSGPYGAVNSGTPTYTQVRPPQQPVPSPSYIPGRMVNQESEIVPNEVPSDGSYGIFIQSDLKRIFAKTVGGDGLIHTNVYELSSGSSTTTQQDDILYNIMARLDNIEKMMTKNNRPYTKPNNYKGQKNKQVEPKGGVVNE